MAIWEWLRSLRDTIGLKSRLFVRLLPLGDPPKLHTLFATMPNVQGTLSCHAKATEGPDPHLLMPVVLFVAVGSKMTDPAPQKNPAARAGGQKQSRLGVVKTVFPIVPSLSVILCARHNQRIGAYYAEQSEESGS